MIDCVSVKNMCRSDAYTIANIVPSMELIRRAAYGVFRSVDWNGRIAIVTGSGNNGADGFALACILKENQIDCTVYMVSERMHSECAAYAQKAQELGVPILSYKIDCLNGYDQIVDCMLGTGFTGTLRASYRGAIEEINASKAYIISVDINSGMNGDTGEAEAAVVSDLTVTIGFVKKGTVSTPAFEYIGHLLCVDIGIVLAEQEDKICDPGEWESGYRNDGCNMVYRDGINYYRCPSYLDMNIKVY